MSTTVIANANAAADARTKAVLQISFCCFGMAGLKLIE
jgi:hypothetical protein